jgi:hypothetical protein
MVVKEKPQGLSKRLCGFLSILETIYPVDKGYFIFVRYVTIFVLKM